MSSNLELTKRRILDSARDLLVGRGIQNLTLDEVAKKAGVAKGTLFLHYKSKEELLRSAYLDLAYSLEAALKKIEDSNLKGQALLEKRRRRFFLILIPIATFSSKSARIAFRDAALNFAGNSPAKSPAIWDSFKKYWFVSPSPHPLPFGIFPVPLVFSSGCAGRLSFTVFSFIKEKALNPGPKKSFMFS